MKDAVDKIMRSRIMHAFRTIGERALSVRPDCTFGLATRILIGCQQTGHPRGGG